MSAISSLGAPSQLTSGSNAFSELSSEEFVKIMFTELSNQDPLKPNDSTALLEQMAALRSIQSDLELHSKLSDLITRSEFASATSLLGHTISGLDESNIRVVGVVRSVSRTPYGPVLNLDNGARVPFGGVDQMLFTQRQPDQQQQPPNRPSSDESEPD
jgi:flagellar hook assembly protein FlgD